MNHAFNSRFWTRLRTHGFISKARMPAILTTRRRRVSFFDELPRPIVGTFQIRSLWQTTGLPSPLEPGAFAEEQIAANLKKAGLVRGEGEQPTYFVDCCYGVIQSEPGRWTHKLEIDIRQTVPAPEYTRKVWYAWAEIPGRTFEDIRPSVPDLAQMASGHFPIVLNPVGPLSDHAPAPAN